MRLSGHTQEVSFCRATVTTWTVRIPLSESDYINLEHPAQTPVRDGAVPHLINLVQARMQRHSQSSVKHRLAAVGER